MSIGPRPVGIGNAGEFSIELSAKDITVLRSQGVCSVRPGSAGSEGDNLIMTQSGTHDVEDAPDLLTEQRLAIQIGEG